MLEPETCFQCLRRALGRRRAQPDGAGSSSSCSISIDNINRHFPCLWLSRAPPSPPTHSPASRRANRQDRKRRRNPIVRLGPRGPSNGANNRELSPLIIVVSLRRAARPSAARYDCYNYLPPSLPLARRSHLLLATLAPPPADRRLRAPKAPRRHRCPSPRRTIPPDVLVSGSPDPLVVLQLNSGSISAHGAWQLSRCFAGRGISTTTTTKIDPPSPARPSSARPPLRRSSSNPLDLCRRWRLSMRRPTDHDHDDAPADGLASPRAARSSSEPESHFHKACSKALSLPSPCIGLADREPQLSRPNAITSATDQRFAVI